MNDITKMIAELKELEARATRGKWDSWLGQIKDESADGFSIGECRSAHDATLIVAMRNALPELIAEIERAEYIRTAYSTKAWEAAIARAEKAEATLKNLPDWQLDCIEARMNAEQMQAERDVSIEWFISGPCHLGCPLFGRTDCPANNTGHTAIKDCREALRSLVAQEAAKRGEEV